MIFIKRKIFYICCAAILTVLIPYNIHLTRRDVERKGNQGNYSTSYCPICKTAPVDGVALVDTQTGRTTYLEVWLPHETYAGQAAPWNEQQNSGGYFSFSKFGEGMGYGESPSMGTYRMHFTLEDLEEKAYLCDYHAPLVLTPYVLVDTQQEPRTVYAVEDEREYKIRLNDVTIRSDDKDYTIEIVSHLFDEEMGVLIDAKN